MIMMVKMIMKMIIISSHLYEDDDHDGEDDFEDDYNCLPPVWLWWYEDDYIFLWPVWRSRQSWTPDRSKPATNVCKPRKKYGTVLTIDWWREGWKATCMNRPNLEELSFLMVFALPNASRIVFASRICCCTHVEMFAVTLGGCSFGDGSNLVPPSILSIVWPFQEKKTLVTFATYQMGPAIYIDKNFFGKTAALGRGLTPLGLLWHSAVVAYLQRTGALAPCFVWLRQCVVRWIRYGAVPALCALAIGFVPLQRQSWLVPGCPQESQLSSSGCNLY